MQESEGGKRSCNCFSHRREALLKNEADVAIQTAQAADWWALMSVFSALLSSGLRYSSGEPVTLEEEAKAATGASTVGTCKMLERAGADG